MEDEVAVLVPQKNISCLYKTRVEKQPIMLSHSCGGTRVSSKTESHPDGHCPVCNKDFQDEMRMLDHFLEIHRPLELGPDMKDSNAMKSKAMKRTVRKISKRENSDPQPKVETGPQAQSLFSGYSKRYNEKQSLHPSVFGMVAGFSVKEWSSIAQIMALTWLLGLDGFFHVLEQLLVEMSVDISRLKLLLSGDVEQNPGPMQCVCHWKDCNMVFSSVGHLSQHLMSNHSPASTTCNWKMCAYWNNNPDYRELESHIISHVYLEEYQFLTIEEWINALPNGEFSPLSTDLNWCPRHLRPQLNLENFDEKLVIEKKPYTVEDHTAYLASLSLEESATTFAPESNSISQKSTALSIQTDNENITPLLNKKPIKSCSVITSRNELANNFSVKFKNTSNTLTTNTFKRKCQETESSNEPWADTLLSNLNKCERGINFECEVLGHLKDIKFLREGHQKGSFACSFFAFEDAVFKLASIPNCTAGVFVYTIFKYPYNQQDHYYIRYLESGYYTGFMEEEHMQDILKILNTTEEFIFLSKVATPSDIVKSKTNLQAKKTAKQAAKQDKKGKDRDRGDMAYSRNKKTADSKLEDLLKESEVTKAGLNQYVFHCVQAKVNVKMDTEKHGEKIVLNSNIQGIDYFETLRKKLFEFPTERKSIVRNSDSEIFIQTELPAHLSMLKQSIALNNLSCASEGHINSSGGKLGTRFLTRFPDHGKACSFRNKIMYLFNRELTDSLVGTFRDYMQPSSSLPIHSNNKHFTTEKQSKKRKLETQLKQVKITTDMIAEQASFVDLDDMIIFKDTSMSIFDSYKNKLITSENGKMVIQNYVEKKSLTMVLNDVDEEEGHFKDYDFVITSWYTTEIGDYFKCSCKIYKTLLDLNDTADPNLYLDSQGTTCMHCRFLREVVLPNLNVKPLETLSEKKVFVQKSIDDFRNKKIVELTSSDSSRKTSKFSVLENGIVSFLSLSYNSRKMRYIASCHNGFCKSKKGSKRYIESLENADLCPHLSILKANPQYWKNYSNLDNSITREIPSDEETSISQDENNNFDPITGLWSFPCKSKHKPRKKGDESLVKNIRYRDTLIYDRLTKTDDGCLNGPNLIPEIPEKTCACGSGWTNSENPEGIIVDTRRILTIYTYNAPIKCKVYNRNCINGNPCSQQWDEGEKLCLHVLSNETAAGDEIGWDFVNQVLNSQATFSSYCTTKTDHYQMRDPYCHKFMDPKTFLKWWFSWAASMKKDFRRPCPACKYSPKQLACDGTKVGIGLRHVDFKEISKPDNDNVLPTLHRRLDRCFISNDLPNLSHSECREHLFYLGKKTLNELTDFLNLEEEERKTNNILLILPDNVKASFERFLNDMPVKEKEAYAEILKMLSTTAPVSSLLPTQYAEKTVRLVNYLAGTEEQQAEDFARIAMAEMRTYAPELRQLIECSLESNDNPKLMADIADFLRHLVDISLNLDVHESEPAVPQHGTYNPAKFGRAYYFSPTGERLRNVRKFSIDAENNKNNANFDDSPADFDKCTKDYTTKTDLNAKGTSTLFLWFCPNHGHCYGFHMTCVEGRKDPSASLYTHLETPPDDIFYDFACNLQEYCLNRESGFYKSVRFFHDIFHGFGHKCSCAYKSTRLQGFETVNSEICEQFNAFIQCIKSSAQQMNQEHFCFYLQFFLDIWNEKKEEKFQRRLKVAQAGMGN